MKIRLAGDGSPESKDAAMLVTKLVRQLADPVEGTMCIVDHRHWMPRR
jgi:hypothetical protein